MRLRDLFKRWFRKKESPLSLWEKEYPGVIEFEGDTARLSRCDEAARKRSQNNAIRSLMGGGALVFVDAQGHELARLPIDRYGERVGRDVSAVGYGKIDHAEIVSCMNVLICKLSVSDKEGVADLIMEALQVGHGDIVEVAVLRLDFPPPILEMTYQIKPTPQL